MRPGAPLRPRDLAVGARLQARDPAGFWYSAKVIEKQGYGTRASIVVHYTEFGKGKGAFEKFTDSVRTPIDKTVARRPFETIRADP